MADTEESTLVLGEPNTKVKVSVTAWLTAQKVNQTFIVAIKTMVYFIDLFSGEAKIPQ